MGPLGDDRAALMSGTSTRIKEAPEERSLALPPCEAAAGRPRLSLEAVPHWTLEPVAIVIWDFQPPELISSASC